MVLKEQIGKNLITRFPDFPEVTILQNITHIQKQLYPGTGHGGSKTYYSTQENSAEWDSHLQFYKI